LTTGLGRSRNRLPLSELVAGLPGEKWPNWLSMCPAAARLAPSAANRQPWNLNVQDDRVIVYVRTRPLTFNLSQRLDCRIAMPHLKAGAVDSGCRWGMGILTISAGDRL